MIRVLIETAVNAGARRGAACQLLGLSVRTKRYVRSRSCPIIRDGERLHESVPRPNVRSMFYENRRRQAPGCKARVAKESRAGERPLALAASPVKKDPRSPDRGAVCR